MHPDPRFRPADGAGDSAGKGDLIDRAVATGFAHLFAATSAGPMVAHAPLTRHGAALRFHVSRANRIAAHLDGARVLASVVAVDGYVSPNWYAPPGNQVPTWNYVAIEIEGPVTAIGDAALIEQVDALANLHEPRVIPDDPWTRAKMDPAVFAKMLRGIRGFELVPDAIRGTTKLSQNKTVADRAGVVAGLRRAGMTALAEAMAAAT